MSTALHFRKIIRSLGFIGEAGWIVLLTVAAVIALVAFGTFRAGEFSSSQPIFVLDWFLLVALLGGFWIGYQRTNGHRPIGQRLVSKTSWLYQQALPSFFWLVIFEAVTLISYFVGRSWQFGIIWWQIGILKISLLLIVVGLAFLGIGLAVLLKLVARNYLVRAALVLLAAYGLSRLIGDTSPLLRAAANIWEQANTNNTLLLLFFSLGLAGSGIALAELTLSRYPINNRPSRRYWQLRVPSGGLAQLGAGTALVMIQLLYYLRSTRLQRNFLTAILLGVVGVIGLNFLQPNYPRIAPTLFIGVLVAICGYLALVFSFTTGKASERNRQSWRTMPIGGRKITVAYLCTALLSVLVVSVIILKLFGDSFSLNQLSLILEAALLVSFSSFQLGRVSTWLAHRGDPVVDRTIGALAWLIIVIFVVIIIFFQNTVSSAATAVTLLIWGFAAILMTFWQQQKLTARTS